MRTWRQYLEKCSGVRDMRFDTPPHFIKLFLLIFVIFIFSTFLIVFVTNGIDFDAPTRLKPASVSYENIEDVNDYDAACSGHPYGEILKEQKRVLESVRKELIDSQAKLDEMRVLHDQIQRRIPQLQLEQSKTESEIEVAQRALQELQDRRNVRVFLPHQPIFPEQIDAKIQHQKFSEAVVEFDDFIDFSRCSISTFMPVNVVSFEDNLSWWLSVFKKNALNPVDDKDKACINVVIVNGSLPSSSFANQIVVNIGKSIEGEVSTVIVQSHVSNSRRRVDVAVMPDLEDTGEDSRKELTPLLPYLRKTLLTLIVDEIPEAADLDADVENLKKSATSSEDSVHIVDCRRKENDSICQKSSVERVDLFRNSLFCAIFESPRSLYYFVEAIRSGCVPIVLSSKVVLPFEDLLDWRLASYRLPRTRFPELHFIVRSFAMEDTLEMRRKGLSFYQNYLGDKQTLAKTIYATLRHRLLIPTFEKKSSENNKAIPLFGSSFIPPKSVPANTAQITAKRQQMHDDADIGPLELPFNSPSYLHNFSSLQFYAYDAWNNDYSPWKSPEFLRKAVDPPTEAEFYPDSNLGFRPIEPGSGVEFSRALGGNRQREQFTVILLTYERDDVLVDALERLHQIPYLNKVIVVWNNIGRVPDIQWPSLHVPVEFVAPTKNSLNNRFVPWDRIETEAVLSLDDDIDLMQQEIVFAFRVWRENRDRIVGFPARYHARFGDEMFYDSNHTCQMSIILTGAAFIHKTYLEEYTYRMPESIRRHVDDVLNCEDIAMNFLVSHLTRKPPIKTTSRWTLKCPTCTDKLSSSTSHFNERHECIRLFTKIYGYNPLKFSQFRADSILFKTRVPSTHQKCFTFV